MRNELELLAPAGSYETFQAVIRAGADAVYLGGSQFGARAYANNFTEEELLQAIDFAHVHGRQVYLTVNTLFKDAELEGRLYDYLLPYYEHGLDAVIVQDMGAFSLIRREFPGLDIHTSTQMTVTGVHGAEYMKELGASRVVTAREMSYAEIREIRDKVDVEIESFVHGALCYCYSGQCLLSSMLGGRSGNRGRCAQPCRLPYEVFDDKKHSVPSKGGYVLSPKDLCTISNIPKLAESGIYSFKIEGRMKQAEYAAGVVSIYRAYMDSYLKDLAKARATGKSEDEARAYAAKRYQVTQADMKKLLDLGNRSGFTDGYYVRHNGKEMITFGKPGHAKSNEALQSEIREKYIHAKTDGAEIKEKINGILRLKKDSSATIELHCGTHSVSQSGDIVQSALKQPLSYEKVNACMQKTGNTPFVFDELMIEMDDDIFMPVQALNQLRREALEQLEQAMVADCRRENPKQTWNEMSEKRAGVGTERIGCEHSVSQTEQNSRTEAKKQQAKLIVSVENRSMLDEVLTRDFVDEIYCDSSCYQRNTLFEQLKADAKKVHDAGKKIFYILPAIFKSSTAAFYQRNAEEMLQLGIDGIVVKSYDSAAFAKKYLAKELDMILDHSLYTWNKEAKELLGEYQPLRDTAPLELNRRELMARDNHNSEMVIYGYLPLMTSAQCVHGNVAGCDKTKTVTYLKDRYGKYFPVKNNCSECYNTIYNTTPMMLFASAREIGQMGMAGYRICFTIESREQAGAILDMCKQTFLSGKRELKEVYAGEYTNGHYKRGVE